MVSYTVNLYEDAFNFVTKLDEKLKAKVYRTIALLEEYGALLSLPHSKKITGYEGLYELRIQQSNNIVRLFYFHFEDNLYIVTSGYVKKDQKLKKGEIDKAAKIMNTLKEGNK